jgi:hypothetical protein
LNYSPNSLENENLNREEFEVETINIESAKVFRQYGGIEVKLVQNKKKFNIPNNFYLFVLDF